MNKSGNTPKPDSNNAKKSPTNFVRKTAKLATSALGGTKSPIFESQLKKESGFLKKPNDSWEY